MVEAIYLEPNSAFGFIIYLHQLVFFAARCLQGFEMVKAIYLEGELFSVDNDLLTPTFKLRRPQLQAKYQGEIDAMYAALKK